MGALADRRIAVTRDERRDGPLAALLREAGAIPVARPTTEVAALHDPEARWRLLPDPAGLGWLVATSARTVERLAASGWLERRPPGL